MNAFDKPPLTCCDNKEGKELSSTVDRIIDSYAQPLSIIIATQPNTPSSDHAPVLGILSNDLSCKHFRKSKI